MVRRCRLSVWIAPLRASTKPLLIAVSQGVSEMEEEDIDFDNACGNYDERYTCPNCYYDHSISVDRCEQCDVRLHCFDEEVTRHCCAEIRQDLETSQRQ